MPVFEKRIDKGGHLHVEWLTILQRWLHEILTSIVNWSKKHKQGGMPHLEVELYLVMKMVQIISYLNLYFKDKGGFFNIHMDMNILNLIRCKCEVGYHISKIWYDHPIVQSRLSKSYNRIIWPFKAQPVLKLRVCNSLLLIINYRQHL